MKIKPRIISGTLRGLKLEVSDFTRPVTDRVKRTIFDIINNYVKDTHVLDIFSGSGNLAIEAISRGAKSAVMVDSDQQSISAIYKNVQKGLIDDKVKIVKINFEKYLHKNQDRFDLIFIDPPFSILKRVKLSKFELLLTNKGIIVIKIESKERKNYKIPISLQIVQEKKIGVNHIIILKQISENAQTKPKDYDKIL